MTEIRTLNDIFFHSIKYQKQDHVLYPSKETYQTFSSSEFYRMTASLSLSLKSLGINRGDRVAILSDDRYEWSVSDFAILTNGSITVPVYPNLTASCYRRILNKAEVSAIILSDEEQLKKILQVREEIPSLMHIIMMEKTDTPGIEDFGNLIHKGQGLLDDNEEAFRSHAALSQPGDPATIIFTSGTTGDPKGVVLTHHNIVSNTLEVASLFDFSKHDIALVFLPLSHILERMANYLYWWIGVRIAYAISLDRLPESLMMVKPSIFCAVPRLYEKMYDRVQESVKDASFVKKFILRSAEKTARAACPYLMENKKLPAGLALKYRLMDRLCFSKIREKLGGRLKFCIAGGAALNTHIARFFIGAGVYIVEGYGLTETSPVLACNTFKNWKLGTVGRPIPSVDIRIAGDGEILVKGPMVFHEYYRDKEATDEVFTEDGFFRTGDIGCLDRDGFLIITDRKKDLIVTAGGKNIAPLPIEETFKRNRFIAQAVMYGDKKPYPVILLVPDFLTLESWAKEKGLDYPDPGALVLAPEVNDLFAQIFEEILEPFSRFQRPKKFALLAEEFTVENGMLTPTMKAKRREIYSKYQGVIDTLYVS